MAELTEEQIRRGDALKIIEKRFGHDNPESRVQRDWYDLQMDVADLLYKLRTAAGLSFEEVGALIGAPAEDVESVEGWDYHGDFIGVLWRAARALGKRVEVRVLDAEEATRSEAAQAEAQAEAGQPELVAA